jgi:hypothetical protein
MPESKVIGILSAALLRALENQGGERFNNCDSVGFVHTTISPEDKTETWIVKFDPKTCAFGILPVETDKYPDGAILYYHGDMAETVTQAALYGDQVADDIDDKG